MNVRLLPYETADGFRNMAADEVLLQTAIEQHVASLRFYGWSPATVSLGYFEPSASRRADSQLAQLPWVRRCTGGGTLVHHYEVTYAVSIPANSLWRRQEPSIFGMHAIILAALAGLGVRGLGLHVDKRPCGDGLCFAKHTYGDVLCRSSKVVGSAQRRRQRALLQHGGILLAQSEHTPSLPGLRELVGVTLNAEQVQQAIGAEFANVTGWAAIRGDWAPDERLQIDELARTKYSAAMWNEKR